MPQIRVGLAPWLGGMMLVAAALSLFAFLVAPAGMQLALSVMFGLLGALHLRCTYLLVDGSQAEVKNVLGMTIRTLQFASPHDLQLDGRTLWIQTGDGRKKVSGFSANGEHWAALGEAIARAQAAAPRSASA